MIYLFFFGLRVFIFCQIIVYDFIDVISALFDLKVDII